MYPHRDYESNYKKLQELMNGIGIKVTDDTKPTELFDLVIKLLASYAANQPSKDEVTKHIIDKINRDANSARRGRGI